MRLMPRHLLDWLEPTTRCDKGLVMSKLEQIEKSILELSPDELQAFAAWFEEMQERSFDDTIERDAKSGKLDTLAEKALSELRSGRTRPL